MLDDDAKASYMKDKVLSSGEWKQKGGLYWNWKKGTKTLVEAYNIVTTSKIVKEYTKAI